MRDIILGGKKTWGNFSAMALKLWYCVSENNLFYLSHEEYTNTDIYIIKDSVEGAKFKKFLDKHIDNEDVVKKYILQIALKHIDANVFLSILYANKEKGIQEGYEKCQSDIRKTLGLH